MKKFIGLFSIIFLGIVLTGCGQKQANGKSNPLPNSINLTQTEFEQLKIKQEANPETQAPAVAGSSYADVQKLLGKPSQKQDSTVNKNKVITAQWLLNTSTKIKKPDTLTMSFTNDQLVVKQIKLQSQQNDYDLATLSSDGLTKDATLASITKQLGKPLIKNVFGKSGFQITALSYQITDHKDKMYVYIFQDNKLVDYYQQKSK